MAPEGAPSTTSVAHHPAASRYELLVDGAVASYAEYVEHGDVLVFPHTVTEPSFRGHGFAEQVVRFALDDVRRRQMRVVPSCWFVAKFIDEHPEFSDLIADGATPA